MRALVLRDFGDFRVDEVAAPQPGPGEVAVRVAATGICGSDLHGYTGVNGRRRAGQVMGHETVGRVVAVGEGVTDVAVGVVVTVNPVIACGDCAACAAGQQQACAAKTVIGVSADYLSAFADVFCAPAANVVVLPEDLPAGYGALIEPLAVAYHAAVRGACGPEDTVLVLGGGPIGQSAVLAARRLGAESVVVSEPDPERRALCERLGAVAAAPADLAGALARPASLVLDAVGVSESMRDALAHSAFGARVVLVGMGAPELTVPAYAISTEERTVVGSFCYTAGHFREVAEWVATAPPELAALIEGTVPVADAPEVFAALADGSLSCAGKLLVTFENA